MAPLLEAQESGNHDVVDVPQNRYAAAAIIFGGPPVQEAASSSMEAASKAKVSDVYSFPSIRLLTIKVRAPQGIRAGMGQYTPACLRRSSRMARNFIRRGRRRTFPKSCRPSRTLGERSLGDLVGTAAGSIWRSTATYGSKLNSLLSQAWISGRSSSAITRTTKRSGKPRRTRRTGTSIGALRRRRFGNPMAQITAGLTRKLGAKAQAKRNEMTRVRDVVACLRASNQDTCACQVKAEAYAEKDFLVAVLESWRGVERDHQLFANVDLPPRSIGGSEIIAGWGTFPSEDLQVIVLHVLDDIELTNLVQRRNLAVSDVFTPSALDT
ncbi:hypothetical protein QFC24_006822 [Naganishia onofrii]|uniref:Uncharacterized protein n=1 Tax=Naganishia onofrii TaxID=1851511 RepID=A0ACC2WZK7_9TREE|nr:hypothetical protein QFC24_006822 [Naganishia onofrii]